MLGKSEKQIREDERRRIIKILAGNQTQIEEMIEKAKPSNTDHFQIYVAKKAVCESLIECIRMLDKTIEEVKNE